MDPFFLSPEEVGSIESDENGLVEVMRNKILKLFPSIQLSIERGENERAKKRITKIKYSDFGSRIQHLIIKNSGKLAELLIEAFPELNLELDDFRVKKYRWSSEEDAIDNIRDAIFSNYPDVEKAIAEGNFDIAEEWISSMELGDLYDIGLRYVAQGRVSGFTTKKDIFLRSFPELKNLEEKIKNKKGKGYSMDDVEKRKVWGERFREVVLENFQEVKELIEVEGELDKAKLVIIKGIKEIGVNNFIVSNINSIRGARVGSSITDFLRIAFPEIDWSDVVFRGRKRKNND